MKPPQSNSPPAVAEHHFPTLCRNVDTSRPFFSPAHFVASHRVRCPEPRSLPDAGFWYRPNNQPTNQSKTYGLSFSPIEGRVCSTGGLPGMNRFVVLRFDVPSSLSLSLSLRTLLVITPSKLWLAARF